MEEFFKNKYRVNSLRLPNWDYNWPAIYYVTICTKDRICCLCEIENDRVYLSDIGKFVFECWLEIQKHFDYVELDDWIIMPNHLHGIIVIKDKDKDFGFKCRDKACLVSTKRKFGHPPPKSLSSIIGSFKSAATNRCHKNNLIFQWQSNYYEHIIKNEDDYSRIKAYIANNPLMWEFDRNNPNNLK